MAAASHFFFNISIEIQEWRDFSRQLYMSIFGTFVSKIIFIITFFPF